MPYIQEGPYVYWVEPARPRTQRPDANPWPYPQGRPADGEPPPPDPHGVRDTTVRGPMDKV